MLVTADYALTVTLAALAVWVVLFPVIVQGLIIYAVILARGERRQNEESTVAGASSSGRGRLSCWPLRRARRPAAALPGAHVSAHKVVPRVDYPGLQHLHYEYGPIAHLARPEHDRRRRRTS